MVEVIVTRKNGQQKYQTS